MLPEVEKFKEARRVMDEFHQQGTELIQDGPRYTGSRYDRINDLGNVRNYLLANEWELLLATTSDPLAKYLIRIVRRDFPEYAIMALEILPATVADFDELARDNNWCGDYTRYRDRAQQLGYFRDEDQTEEGFKLVGWYRDQRTENGAAVSPQDVATFRQLVDAAIEAELIKVQAADSGVPAEREVHLLLHEDDTMSACRLVNPSPATADPDEATCPHCLDTNGLESERSAEDGDAVAEGEDDEQPEF